MLTRSFSPSQRRAERGSVLMITLIIALVLGLSLTSYLLLVRAQSVAVARSQAWHAAMTAAEAGVEEALAQLNLTPFAPNVVFAKAWQQVPGGYRLVELRKLAVSPPLGSSSYNVFLKSSTPPGSTVTICSTGFASVPFLSTTLSRALEVQVTNPAVFSMAALTKGTIAMNGRNLATDSFDSTSPYRSTGGRYDNNKLSKPRDWHGDVACGLGIRDAGLLDVHGKMSLGLSATNRPGPNFKVSGAMGQDFNADLPDAQAPFASGTGQTPKSGKVGNTNYTYILKQDANYQLSLLNGSLFVTNDANAVLYVTGNATMTNVVLGPRASVRVYVGGANAQINALSHNGTATNFQYFGLRNNTNLMLPALGSFIGTIYAPNARLMNAGAGSNTLDFQGALVANGLDLRSHLKLHFDESLKANPPSFARRGFIVTSWKEVP